MVYDEVAMSRFKTLSFFVLVFMIIPIGAFASTGNPQFRYAFDSNFADSVGNFNLGVEPFEGVSPPFISGAILKIGNGSLNLSGGGGGTYNGLESSSSDSVPNEETLNLWVNYTVQAQSAPIFTWTDKEGFTLGSNDRWEFGILTNGTLYLDLRNGTHTMQWIDIGRTLTPNIWNSISITSHAQNPPTFFINGVGGTTSNNSNIDLNAAPIGTVMHPAVGMQPISGSTFAKNIDELAGWFKILTNTDLTGLYNAGAGQAFPYTNTTNVSADLAFNVSFYASSGLKEYTQVTLNESPGGDTVKYALACDIKEMTLWNELFRNGYNFTTQNVTTPVFNPEQFLTATGVQFAYSNATPAFFLGKTANQAYRQVMTARIPYTHVTSGNSVVDVFFLASDSTLTYALEINKTGTSYSFKRLNTGGVLTNLTTQTITTGFVDLGLVFNPITDAGTGQDYFGITLQLGNTTIGNDTTRTYIGTNIQGVEWYTDQSVSANQTLKVTSMGLFSTSNIAPFTTFQNTGGTVTNAAGYTIIASQADSHIFYGVCQYTQNGTYTQRHYVSDPNLADDYSNYHDLTVAVCSDYSTGTFPGAVTTGTACDAVTSQNPTVLPTSTGTDLANDFIPALLDALGLHSSASRVLFWIGLSLIISVVVFTVHPIAGLLVFIGMVLIGVVISILPLWIVIIFVVICAGLFAFGVRYLFGGS